MKRFITKKMTAVTAVVLACTTVLFSMPIMAQSLDEAQKKQEELQRSLNEANKLIDSLKNSKSNTESSIRKIDKEIDTLEAENDKVSAEIEAINSDIEDLNLEIDDTKQTLEIQSKNMTERIVYSYESGRNNILNALFTSKDLSEFLNILQLTIDLAKYDRKVMEKYEQTLQILSKQTDALSKKQEDAQRLEKENEDRIGAIAALKTAKEGELAGLDEELTDAKEIAAVYEKEMQAQNEVLAALQAAIAAEREREQQAVTPSSTSTEQNNSEAETTNNGNTDGNTAPENQPVTPQEVSKNTSGFVWPCPSSHRITSEFGPRESPTAGASTNHKGIDIGAKTGSDILAVQSGTVILSQYSNSAGNYIIINHGKNAQGKIICTVYMHANERYVSVGQKVEKGQKIAAVGSTGYSTGPHLHFGVTEDGAYVNPWSYL